MLLLLFPVYAGNILRTIGSTPPTAQVEATQVLFFTVEGMTCEACAVHLEQSLANIPGVVDSSVSYREKRAVLSVDADSPPSAELIRGVAAKVGYKIEGAQ